MNRNEFTKLFPAASESVIDLNCGEDSVPQNTRKAPKLERVDRPRQLALAQSVEKTGAERLLILVISVRKRLLDSDNLVPKWTIDSLRFAGIIQGDEPEKVTIQTSQRKVLKGEEEHTQIEIWKL